MAACLDQFHQAGLLQLPHVVAHLLTRQLKAAGDAGGGVGFAQLVQNA